MFTHLEEIRAALRAEAKPELASSFRQFFQAGPGGYGEGDHFLGVRVPPIRLLARQSDGLPLAEVKPLLRSRWHEERLLGLHVLARRYERSREEAERAEIVRLYGEHLPFVNNWDLVDASAPTILGPWLREHERECLLRMVRSENVWERRVAMVATFAFIRAGEVTWTFRLAEMLLSDRHDLIHKAVGWMLREAGKRDEEALRRFLEAHCATMPRTMLRYALERLPGPERARYLALRGERAAEGEPPARRQGGREPKRAGSREGAPRRA